MDAEVTEALREYLLGDLTRGELNRFITAFDWTDLSAENLELQPIVGHLELLLEEIEEGLRPEGELQALVLTLLAEEPHTKQPASSKRAPST